jgi:glycerol uptake facilitator-like aquaporin
VIKRYAAEALGTALLLAAVVGSGVMGDRLSAGNAGVALLANSIATGGALYVLILGLGPVSGAHFNPIVTAIEAVHRRLAPRHALGYVVAQIVGAIAGVVLAHAMFGLDLVQSSTHVRATHGELLGEVVATFGLWLVIATAGREKVAGAVALYIVAAYWFTSSTSFANPAVTIARSLTDTFAGIRAADVPGFIAAQLAGGALAAATTAWLLPLRQEPS